MAAATGAAAILTPDICVIGGGSGGLTVAATAAAFGVPVVLVERARMGGDCLNTGCVPSKALIAAARRAAEVRDAGQFGIGAGEPRVDFKAVMAHVHATIAAIAPHDSVERFEGLGVTVIKANARFVDADTVEAGGRLIRARRFVIATGSRAAVPPIPGLATVPYLTNETLFDLETLPSRLAIVGGGPIGLEMAQAFGRLGAEVVVLEAGALLGREDPELAAVAIAAVAADGVELIADCRIERIEATETGVAIAIAGPEGSRMIAASHLLVAAGRAPNVEGLGLEAAGIAASAAGIKVDAGLHSANRRVLAIGDVADVAGRGPVRFTHAAGWHGGLAIRSLLFRLPVRADRQPVPRVTYTNPEIAQAGLTEAEARALHGDRIRVLRSAFADNDRARAEATTAGLIKLVADARGRILGAGIVGPHAGELIAMWSLAIGAGLKLRHVAGMLVPYPTLAEIGKRAAIGYYAPSSTSPWLRKLIRLLRLFG
ncbi:MAG: FAD-dependent oxidoreductase [Hyphomicrobiaceae bacterium]|nr:FAD-dependent oxidoreductase [Hyphomicrobiaceae bacterium]